MRTPIRLLWTLAVVAPAWATTAVAAGPSAPQVIGTQQINRFEAIRQLQQTVKQNSKSLADWVILGELAHEVAIDLPADQAATYYKMSRNAYENALELAPDNLGVKAAVQFAKDQEQGLDRFEKSRTAATRMYLAARRRDLAATRFTPSLRVFGPTMAPSSPMTEASNLNTGRATTATTRPNNTAATASSARNDPATRKSATEGEVAVTPGETATNSSTGQSSANFGVRQFYSYPAYQTYAPTQGAPLTYQQFSNSYEPSNTDAGQAAEPVTLQHYYSQQGLPIPGDPTGRPAVSGGTTTTGTPRGPIVTPPRGTNTPTTPRGTTTTPPATPR